MDNEPGKIEIRQVDGTSLIVVTGYLDAGIGNRLGDTVLEQLNSGNLNFVIALGHCSVISSPGMGKLLEIAEKVTQDFKGRLCFCELSNLFLRMLKMVGILPQAEIAPTQEEARALLSKPRPPE